jgi:hypothetical protein
LEGWCGWHEIEGLDDVCSGADFAPAPLAHCSKAAHVGLATATVADAIAKIVVSWNRILTSCTVSSMQCRLGNEAAANRSWGYHVLFISIGIAAW